jgi:hypothetical protein
MHQFDIFLYVCNFLKDTDKIRLTAISNTTDYFKHKLLFTDLIAEDKIYNLPFYDNFENVKVDCRCSHVPKNIKKLHVECLLECMYDSVPIQLNEFAITHLTWDQNSMYMTMAPECFIFRYIKLPNTITHLILSDLFDQDIKHMPESVTHLKLGFSFSRPIECIPRRVTHLELGYLFYQSISNCISSSITHLTWDHVFDNLNIISSTSVIYIRKNSDDQYVRIDECVQSS